MPRRTGLSPLSRLSVVCWLLAFQDRKVRDHEAFAPILNGLYLEAAQGGGKHVKCLLFIDKLMLEARGWRLKTPKVHLSESSLPLLRCLGSQLRYLLLFKHMTLRRS